MTSLVKTFVRISIATLIGVGALFSSGEVPLNSERALISSAHAVIGRPLTPLSYAGVARRTTRRTTVVAPVVVAPVVVTPTCVQAVDAYGRIYTRC